MLDVISDVLCSSKKAFRIIASIWPCNVYHISTTIAKKSGLKLNFLCKQWWFYVTSHDNVKKND